MGVLQDFERRLEGAVEGFFARTFRSGLQPVELAKALQRYAQDTRHVAHDGVVVPNVFRFRVHPDDLERLRDTGVELEDELSQLVVATAVERGWVLRGAALVTIEGDDEVPFGRYDLAARVEATARGAGVPARADDEDGPAPGSGQAAAPVPPTGEDDAPRPARVRRQEPPGPADDVAAASLRVVEGGEQRTVDLRGRTVVGRDPEADVHLPDGSVSRQHAALVRREATWWVVDLGSTNGTAVNGRHAGEHALHDGDRIELGEALLEFVEG